MKNIFNTAFIFIGLSLLAMSAQAEGDLASSHKTGWGGLYVGLNSGMATQTDATECVSGTWDCSSLPIANPMQKAAGSTQGVQFGYNWEIDSDYIVGLELGAQKTSLHGSAVFPTDGQYKSADTTYETLNTFQIRLGRELENNLLYVTGGLAWATLNTRFLNRYNSGAIINYPNGLLDFNTTTKGYVLGVGVEHALTESLSIGCELSQTYFQQIQLDISTQVNGGEARNWAFEKVNPNLTLLKLAVNYRF